MTQVRVKKRSRDNNGNPVGRADDNLINDSREYVVEFEDGVEAKLAANVITQCMYAQCDHDGHMYVLFSTTDFRCNPTCTAKRLLGFHFALSVFSKLKK